MPTTAISVIIPIYNRAEYLPDCLASIECQTLSNIEVLCIDDASTDASAAVVEQFAQDDSRFKLFSLPENQGAAVARNFGIEQATGEFIAFMDSDDWYPENTTLEKLYNAATRHHVDIAGGSFSVFHSASGETVSDFNYDPYLKNYFSFKENGLINYCDWQGDYGYTRFIFQRQLIEDNLIRFPRIARQEDPIFFVRAMLAAKTFYAISDVVYCCRTGHKSEYLTFEDARNGMDALLELVDISIEEDLPILRQHQYDLIRWFAFDAPIWREYDSWKELGAILSKQAKDSLQVRTDRLQNLFHHAK